MSGAAAVRHITCGVLALATLLGLMLAQPSWGQVRSTMSDDVRGVTFHSIEISDDEINDLEVLDGTFSPSDRLVVGLSAMLFDGSGKISNHIVWIRHEGRKWLDYGLMSPVEIVADGWSVPIEALRSPQSFIGAGGRMIEKLEFLVDSAHFDRLVSADEITVLVRSETGNIDKVLSEQEVQLMREFLDEIPRST
jgi:hypothetical protein